MANIFDSANAPEKEPEQIVMGDFVQWKNINLVDDYPTASNTLTYTARKIGGSEEFKIVGSGQVTHYLFTATSSETAAYAPGKYRWQLELLETATSKRVVISRGEFDVVADLDNADADLRTHAEIMLTKIESILVGKADSDVASYSVAGRSLNKMSFQELLDARNFYKGEVVREKAAENAKQGRKNAATIKVRF